MPEDARLIAITDRAETIAREWTDRHRVMGVGLAVHELALALAESEALVASHARAVDGRAQDQGILEVIRKWRETAQIWEDQELGRGAYYGSPVGNGKGNIQNWCNWLRGCADEIEAAIKAQPVVATRPHEQEQVVQDTWKAQAERGVEQFQTLMTEHLALRDALTAKDQQLAEAERLNHKWMIDYGMLAKSKAENETALAEARQQLAALSQLVETWRYHQLVAGQASVELNEPDCTYAEAQAETWGHCADELLAALSRLPRPTGRDASTERIFETLRFLRYFTH